MLRMSQREVLLPPGMPMSQWEVLLQATLFYTQGILTQATFTSRAMHVRRRVSQMAGGTEGWALGRRGTRGVWGPWGRVCVWRRP